jgi:hypothetical protein
MSRFSKKQWIVAGVAAATVASGAAVAYAYWTASGSGSGSASVATSNGTVNLAATFAGGLTPGASEAVTYTAWNTNSSNLDVTTVSAVVSIDSPHATAGCLASWFVLATPGAVNEGATGTVIPANTPQASPVTLPNGNNITFTDLPSTNQDACKGATVTLALTSN